MTKFDSIFVAALVVGTALAAPANAAPIVNFTPGTSVSALTGYNVVQDFNGAAGSYGLSGGVQGTDYQILSGNVTNVGAVPNNSGTPYLAVLGGKQVTYTFAAAAGQIAFDWGTASADNTLFLTDVFGNTTSFVVPSSNANAPVNSNYNVNGVLISSGNGAAIKSLTFASGKNSFEVDNIAVAVPEPATWAMILVGFGMMGASMRYRRRATNVVYA